MLDLIDCTSISKTKKSFERKNVETFLNRKGSDVPLQTPQGNSREQGEEKVFFYRTTVVYMQICM